MVAERALVIVWDGLRPDFVTEETPNLWQLGQRGVWFERGHAVYPTLTRANSPAISTGCRPGRAGVPGNSLAGCASDEVRNFMDCLASACAAAGAHSPQPAFGRIFATTRARIAPAGNLLEVVHVRAVSGLPDPSADHPPFCRSKSSC
jgi:hypothetical protein